VLRRLAALPAREEALEPAAEPGRELVFFPRALPVGETPALGLPAPEGLAAPDKARAPTSTVPTPRRLPVEISDLAEDTVPELLELRDDVGRDAPGPGEGGIGSPAWLK